MMTRRLARSCCCIHGGARRVLLKDGVPQSRENAAGMRTGAGAASRGRESSFASNLQVWEERHRTSLLASRCAAGMLQRSQGALEGMVADLTHEQCGPSWHTARGACHVTHMSAAMAGGVHVSREHKEIAGGIHFPTLHDLGLCGCVGMLMNSRTSVMHDVGRLPL